MDFPIFIDNLLLFLGNYGFILVIIFGILHPLTENPWSFLTMALALTLLGVNYGYIVLLISNLIGISLLYIIACKANQGTNYYFSKKKVSKKILEWLAGTPTWKHILVIGLPLIPTYPIKVALPFTEISFKKYVTILLSSYLFLYTSYSLAYFGVLSFLEEEIPPVISFTLLIGFALFVYFGNTVRRRLFCDNNSY